MAGVAIVVVTGTVHGALCRTAAWAAVMCRIANARTGGVMPAVVEIATIPAVQHAKVRTACCGCMTVVVTMAVIVAMSAYDVPCMSATIGCIEYGTSEVEIVAMRIAAIDGKMPESVKPVEWAIEVGRCAEGFPLPVQQDIAQV